METTKEEYESTIRECNHCGKKMYVKTHEQNNGLCIVCLSFYVGDDFSVL